MYAYIYVDISSTLGSWMAWFAPGAGSGIVKKDKGVISIKSTIPYRTTRGHVCAYCQQETSFRPIEGST